MRTIFCSRISGYIVYYEKKMLRQFKNIFKFFTLKNLIKAFCYMFLFKLVYFIVFKYINTELLGTFLSSIIAGSVLIIFKYLILGVESIISPLYCDEDSDDNGESSNTNSKKNKGKEKEVVSYSEIEEYKKKLKEFEEVDHEPRQKEYDRMLRIKEKDPGYFKQDSNFDTLNFVKVLYLVEESKGSPLTRSDMQIARNMFYGMVITREEYEQIGKPVIRHIKINFALKKEEIEKIYYDREN
uniref:GIY endonuclease n=1 Tax=Clonostachys rogersoniana TaxID=122658 RepID=A0A8F1Y2J0_CLORO|nr:GIY endonuclease [Clonostachys rogersoniana]